MRSASRFSPSRSSTTVSRSRIGAFARSRWEDASGSPSANAPKQYQRDMLAVIVELVYVDVAARQVVCEDPRDRTEMRLASVRQSITGSEKYA